MGTEQRQQGNDNPTCQEMKKLRDWLDARKIEWADDSTDYGMMGDAHVYITRTKFKIGSTRYSVINGFGTYGGGDCWEKNHGLLEMMVNNHEPVGWMSADDVINTIEGRNVPA